MITKLFWIHHLCFLETSKHYGFYKWWRGAIELEAFIDKEYDEYVVWRNNNSLLSKNTSPASECVTVYGTFNNTTVSTGCLKSAISTESSTNNNPGSNDAISSGACERDRNGENCLCSFLMEEIRFLRSEINFKNEIIKSLFTSKSMLHNEHFFSHDLRAN